MPLLRMTGIVKSFPGVRALDGVDFDVFAGEVHALMGENGAGKSTLLKVLTGVHPSDEGTIELAGEVVRLASSLEAVERGISAVHQELNLAPNLSVAENVVIGREPRGPFGIRWSEVRTRARGVLERLGVSLDVDRPLGSCSPAIQQLTAIARALDVDARILVLDEPTASLDRDEVRHLFSVIHRLKEQGIGIIYVTHFLDEVYAIADRITVLRNGRVAGSGTPQEIPKRRLVELMIGRDVADRPSRLGSESIRPAPLLRSERLGRKQSVREVTLSVGPGEVLGLAGLLGSGRTETLRLLFGIDRPDEGTVSVDGRTVRLTPRRSIELGLGLSPEERKTEGIFPSLTVRENMLIVSQVRRGWMRKLSKQSVREVERWRESLQIACSDLERPMGTLSGGNQQKTLMARWLMAKPRLLLLDEPTRGIDVGAKSEISHWIERLRSDGMAFVFVSSELAEVAQLATRVAILRDRRIVGELESFDEDQILHRIAEGGP